MAGEGGGPGAAPGRVTFVIGGARSGKSTYAERRAAASGRRVVYVVTGKAGDAEMTARITAHRQKRPAAWETIEEPWRPAAALRRACPPGAVIAPETLVVVDCLTFLVANLALRAVGPAVDDAAAEQVPDDAAARAAADVEAEVGGLVAAALEARAAGADVIVVSNEVGLGLVPPNPVGRLFRDLLGWANQAVAAPADEVYLMVAGIPVCVRGEGA